MRRKLIYVIGSAIIGIITLISVFLILIATGVIDAGQRKLIYRSANAEEVYDGGPLVCNEYSVLHGKLKEGHTANITFTGVQSEVGESENSFSVTILDQHGADVTGDYNLECIFGTLTVSKRPILITTGAATKVYDGTPLVSETWSFSDADAVVSGHVLSVKNTGTQLDVGNCKNAAIVQITDDKGNDVTFNYEVSTQLGDLVVTPRPLQVRSGSSSKYYADDGIPLTCDSWDIVSITQPLDNHNLVVAISGEQYEIGESENTIAEVRITDKETGENKNHNYDITYKPGKLVVKDPNKEDDLETELIKTAFKSGGSLKDNGLSRSDALLARVCSEKDGAIYLRAQSYGDYVGNSWGSAATYLSLLSQRYSYNYLTGASMRNSIDVSSGTVQIQSQYQYMLPYYLGTGTYNYDVQTSDVSYASGRTEYDLKCFFYNGDGSDLKGLLDAYVEEEAAYREFVYNNYLGIYDSDTKAYLYQIIETQGFDKNDPELITKVAQYIQNSAEYNLDYDRALDEEENIVLAFLRSYKQGVCRHYASAATLLYRALGIPARYTVGALGKGAIADTWTDIPASSMHAWVEIYVDGVGWIMVEVTGGPFKYSQKVYSVYPSATYEEYRDEATKLYAKQEILGLSELEKAGYTIQLEVSGVQQGLGKSESVIKSLVIYDRNGNDVTKDFNLKLEKGVVQIYKGQLTVRTESATKQYDGKALFVQQIPEIEGALLDGDRVTVLQCVTQITRIGQEINSFELVIKDRNGNDVTSQYKINRDCGILEITQREIVVVTGSAEKEYDGEDLISNEWGLKDGYTLADGELLAVVCTGIQSDIGESPNYIKTNQTKIFNGNGEDVTRNYKINYELGTLKITKVVEEIPEEPEEA